MNPDAEIRRRAFGVMEGVVTACLLGLGALIFQLNNSVVKLQATVDSMSLQIGDIQSVRGKIAELDVQVKRNAQDIKELQDVRNLK